jgi:hypothetical protein
MSWREIRCCQTNLHSGNALAVLSWQNHSKPFAELGAPFLFSREQSLFSGAAACLNQLVVRQRDSPFSSGQRAYSMAREVRFGRGLVMMAHPRKLREFARFEGKRIFSFPFALGHDLQDERFVEGCQTIDAPALRLLYA